MPTKHSKQSSRASSSPASTEVDALIKKLERYQLDLDNLLKQSKERMSKAKQALENINNLQQRNTVSMNKLQQSIGILNKLKNIQRHSVDGEQCANTEDEVFMVPIPKRYALYLDKKCYHAAELWNWVSKNATVPHTRRKLTPNEVERIKQKANPKPSSNHRRSASATTRSPESRFVSARSSGSSAYLSE